MEPQFEAFFYHYPQAHKHHHRPVSRQQYNIKMDIHKQDVRL